MCSKARLKILTVFLSCSFIVHAQDFSFPEFEDIIEEMVSSSDVELDYTTLFSNLEYLYYNPINLNIATEEELNGLIFLTEFQIFSIIEYRRKYKNFQTIYELQFVDGMDLLSLERTLPFVTVGEAGEAQLTNLSNAFSFGKHELITRYQRLLQEKAGYAITDSIINENPDKSRYLGSPDKFYLKYRYRYKDKLLYGITAEKDDGEQFFRGVQKYGFDFYSAYFQINDIGIVKKLIVGDYLAQFGHGLTMWSGLSFGKLANIIKRPRGVDRYASVNESSFLRGQAATLEFGDFTVTEFFSYKKIDGGIEGTLDTILGEEEYVTSFLETGYHRTPSEVTKRKSVKEFIAGSNVTWNKSRFKIGLTGVYYNFNPTFGGNEKPYTYFYFKGNDNFNLGVDYLLTLKNVILFGETSGSYNSDNIGFATLNGAIFDFVPEFKMSILHRYFQPNYQALYAQPFSEGNNPNNESGIFVGAEIFPKSRWKIALNFDTWKHSWLRYGVNAPSTGMEYVAQVFYLPQQGVDMNVRIKYETKSKNNSTAENGVAPIIAHSTTRLRYHINYNISGNWKLKNRIELSNYNLNDNNEWGYVVYQDVQYAFNRFPASLTMRFAVFDTDSYNTRIYAYEPDALYGFSVPAYYGQGTRIVFLIKYSITKNIDFWFRIANSYYHNQSSLGSGLDFIEGSNRTDIKLQLRIKL